MDKIRVIDTRYGAPASLIFIDATKERGDDGFAVIVVYDDDPNSWVSTGSDHFRVTAQ